MFPTFQLFAFDQITNNIASLKKKKKKKNICVLCNSITNYNNLNNMLVLRV